MEEGCGDAVWSGGDGGDDGDGCDGGLGGGVRRRGRGNGVCGAVLMVREMGIGGA